MQNIGFIFPGQGTQNVGMGVSLCEKYAEVMDLYSRASDILGYDLLELCACGPIEKLTDSRYCQPALFVHQYAIAHILMQRIDVDQLLFLGGLSIGELTALAISGVFDFDTGVQIVKKRGECIQSACEDTRGAMVSILGSTEEELKEICQLSGAEMSNINSPGQIVLSGGVEQVDKAVELIAERTSAKSIRLSVSGAFHSSLMSAAADAFAEYIQDIPFFRMSIPVVSNVTGQMYHDETEIKRLLPVQIVSAVRWWDCMQTAKKLNVLNLYQCGNGKVLINLLRRADKEFIVDGFGDDNL